MRLNKSLIFVIKDQTYKNKLYKNSASLKACGIFYVNLLNYLPISREATAIAFDIVITPNDAS